MRNGAGDVLKAAAQKRSYDGSCSSLRPSRMPGLDGSNKPLHQPSLRRRVAVPVEHGAPVRDFPGPVAPLEAIDEPAAGERVGRASRRRQSARRSRGRFQPRPCRRRIRCGSCRAGAAWRPSCGSAARRHRRTQKRCPYSCRHAPRSHRGDSRTSVSRHRRGRRRAHSAPAPRGFHPARDSARDVGRLRPGARCGAHAGFPLRRATAALTLALQD